MKTIKSLILAALLLVSVVAHSAEPRTEHTLKLSEGEEPPAATIEDAAWLAGSWTGTAFGMNFEEVWNPPSAGTMVGMFKLFGDDGIAFYEILLMTVDDGTLSLKVKHFNPDFTAWEDKAEHVDFRLVAIEDDVLHFSGISFYRRDEHHIDGYIVMRNKEGVQEHELKYYRRAD